MPVSLIQEGNSNIDVKLGELDLVVSNIMVSW